MSPLALVSVSDKKNIIPFCKELVEQFNYKILSSGGTAKHLIEAKIPVFKVVDFTNSPEILGGRVKTLHPKIHGGIIHTTVFPFHLDVIQELSKKLPQNQDLFFLSSPFQTLKGHLNRLPNHVSK